MLAELKKIKMCKLKTGQNVTTLKIPKLNDIQTKLFEIINLTASQKYYFHSVPRFP
jgi:hypothetical protein